jgi:predicted amidohydrolase YtcJ
VVDLKGRRVIPGLYDPFVSLYWMTAGKTMGGLQLYPEKALLSREEAL